MSDNKKLFTAREAAQAVLSKAKEILGESSLIKSEYKTENNPKPGVKYGKIEKDQKALERDYNEYEVKKPGFKDSTGPRQEKQVSPSQNPKEEAEGNNKPDGMEPEFEFKDKVAKELAKEKASHMVKGENPDEKQDAELGEKVEHDVEEHMQENAAAEQKEGHPMAKPGDKAEGSTERASIPMCIGSAKLSKFMEYKHSKRKNAQAQSPEAVGNPAPAAPQAGSTQAGQPNMGKAESSFDKLKNKIKNKEGYSEEGAAGAAYEAGKAKYGKAGMAAKAAAGRKK